ncbi:hypothetical protein LTR50_000813 [Elasticomyces elasticus]|nr:hypothetical protein LTR50_000813 [Elasticomyces elasticus]
MASISSIQSLTLDIPPSCIAFVPEYPNYFVVGTYLLEPSEGTLITKTDDDAGPEAAGTIASSDGVQRNSTKPEVEQKRSGSVILFKIDQDRISLVQTIQTPFAILDIQFRPLHESSDSASVSEPKILPDEHNTPYGSLSDVESKRKRDSRPALAAATSTGSVALYRFDLSTSSLHEERLLQYFDASVLVLSCAWCPSSRDTLGVTLSDGRVMMCETDARAGPEENHCMQRLQHSLEAWTMAYSMTPHGGIFSGGDDAVLQFWTSEDVEGSMVDVSWKDRRIHSAGVTAILPLTGNIVVTGSYDDRIRVIRAPHRGRREVLAELNLGGGVWRIKLMKAVGDGEGTERYENGTRNNEGTDSVETPCREVARYTLLASCMHAGTRIVVLTHLADDSWTADVLARFEEHGSMNYGSDFRPGVPADSPQTIVSTSFYDRLLCLWKSVPA